MSKSILNRLCLLGLIICCAVLCHAQEQNISHTSTFLKKIDNISGFVSHGQYAYVLGHNSVIDQFVNTYDVSDNMDVRLVSTTVLEIINSTFYHAILVHEDRLLIFRDFGLAICDISQPMNPVVVSDVDINGYYQDAALDQDHLLTLYNRTLITWDISSGFQPQLEDYYVYPEATTLFLSGSNAILGTDSTEYAVLNFTDPSSLQFLGTNQNPVSGILKGVSGSNLFFLGPQAMAVEVYDASAVLEPVLIGSIGLGDEYMDLIGSLVLQGTKLAMTYHFDCLDANRYSCAIFEVGDPTSPTLLILNEEYDHDGIFLGDGENRLIFNNYNSFQFVDYAQSPLFGKSIYNSSIELIVANGTHAFACAGGCGVLSLNLSDPLSAFREDQIDISVMNAMCLNENLLAISQGSYYGNELEGDPETGGYMGNTIKLYDVSNPGHIQTINTLYCIGLPYRTRDVRIQDDKILLFNSLGGVEIYDISSPLEPVLVLHLSDGSHHISGILEGNYLYSGIYNTEEDYCVKIYDIADLDAPVELSVIPVNYLIKRIRKSGHFLYVGGSGQSIRIFDVSDPVHPALYASVQVSNVIDFELRDRALIALSKNPQNQYSLSINKIANPLYASWAGSFPLGLGAKCLALSGSNVLIGSDRHAALYDAFAAYNICETSVQDQVLVSPVLRLSCYPNPFQGKVNIDLDLQESGMVKIDIYNARGQKVKSLDPARCSNGLNTVYWDTQAELSSGMPAGIYIIKAKTGTHSASTRMVLLK